MKIILKKDIVKKTISGSNFGAFLNLSSVFPKYSDEMQFLASLCGYKKDVDNFQFINTGKILEKEIFKIMEKNMPDWQLMHNTANIEYDIFSGIPDVIAKRDDKFIIFDIKTKLKNENNFLIENLLQIMLYKHIFCNKYNIKKDNVIVALATVYINEFKNYFYLKDEEYCENNTNHLELKNNYLDYLKSIDFNFNPNIKFFSNEWRELELIEFDKLLKIAKEKWQNLKNKIPIKINEQNDLLDKIKGISFLKEFNPILSPKQVQNRLKKYNEYLCEVR